MRIIPHFCHGESPFFAGSDGARCTSGRAMVAMSAASSFQAERRGPLERASVPAPIVSSAPAWSARDLLDSRDHFVGGLFRRPTVVHDAAHRLGPHVLVVENGELVVLGEFERRGSRAELVV